MGQSTSTNGFAVYSTGGDVLYQPTVLNIPGTGPDVTTSWGSASGIGQARDFMGSVVVQNVGTDDQAIVAVVNQYQPDQTYSTSYNALDWGGDGQNVGVSGFTGITVIPDDTTGGGKIFYGTGQRNFSGSGKPQGSYMPEFYVQDLGPGGGTLGNPTKVTGFSGYDNILTGDDYSYYSMNGYASSAAFCPQNTGTALVAVLVNYYGMSPHGVLHYQYLDVFAVDVVAGTAYPFGSTEMSIPWSYARTPQVQCLQGGPGVDDFKGLVFTDGFESGDVSAWSAIVP
jgi:hypothetical protein